jgi:Spy/CpxP family protein refolding chaperone
MIGPVLLGVAGGLIAARAFSRMRRGRCAQHGRGRFFGLVRALDLDREQRHELRSLAWRVRESLRALRPGRDELRPIVEALAGDTFDRARVEAAAEAQGDTLGRAKAEIVDGLAELHELLRPEQRARLATWFGAAPAPAGGPYR